MLFSLPFSFEDMDTLRELKEEEEVRLFLTVMDSSLMYHQVLVGT